MTVLGGLSLASFGRVARGMAIFSFTCQRYRQCAIPARRCRVLDNQREGKIKPPPKKAVEKNWMNNSLLHSVTKGCSQR